MKYYAVLDTDDFEDFAFFEDGNGKYLHAVDASAVNGEWIYLPFKPLEQVPKTGHWINITNKCGTVIAVRCSNCKNSPKHAMKSDFCPNCGANMIETQ